MKVSTDAVLFGSWCQPKKALRMLDVGTGTGLLSLMLAQKALPESQITALEIDSAAALQACENIQSSPWRDKIAMTHCSFQDYVNSSPGLYDLLISNPPWFLHTPSAIHNEANQHRAHSRTLARQQLTLTLQELFAGADKLLSDDGRLYLLLPASAETETLNLASDFGFYLRQKMNVLASAEHKVHCQLWQFSRCENETATLSEIKIRDLSNHYTPQFVALCKDYYLKF